MKIASGSDEEHSLSPSSSEILVLDTVLRPSYAATVSYDSGDSDIIVGTSDDEEEGDSILGNHLKGNLGFAAESLEANLASLDADGAGATIQQWSQEHDHYPVVPKAPRVLNKAAPSSS